MKTIVKIFFDSQTNTKKRHGLIKLNQIENGKLKS